MNKYLIFLCCIIMTSCSFEKEELKIVSLFANRSDVTYKFYGVNGIEERELDYEKNDSCNLLIMKSAIAASSELYICDLLAKDNIDSAYIEVFFDNKWHLLHRDSSIKIQQISDYLVGQLYSLKENDSIYIDGQVRKYELKEENVFVIDSVDGDFIFLSPISFSLDEYGDASSYNRDANGPQVKFRWKVGNEVVPERLIAEW